MNTTIKQIHDKYKDQDGYLRIYVKEESAFWLDFLYLVLTIIHKNWNKKTILMILVFWDINSICLINILLYYRYYI
jgi:hypothetical protein